jgi:hypothetical protein
MRVSITAMYDALLVRGPTLYRDEGHRSSEAAERVQGVSTRVILEPITDLTPAHVLLPFSSLDKIRICVQHLIRKTPLQRFLQRQDISESIKDCHRCLDGCLELFHVCFDVEVNTSL